MHGIVMVWFFLIPSIPATFGNFLVPLMIGARDLAFPRINLASWYVFNISGLLLLAMLFVGGVDTGWTFYTPFSTLFSNGYVVAAALAVFINGFSSIMTGLNFVVTIHRLRAPGMTWYRLPLFVWAIYATSLDHAAGDAGAGDDAAAGGGRPFHAASASSTRRSAATRCSSSTCSGSIRTPPSTS